MNSSSIYNNLNFNLFTLETMLTTSKDAVFTKQLFVNRLCNNINDLKHQDNSM